MRVALYAVSHIVGNRSRLKKPVIKRYCIFPGDSASFKEVLLIQVFQKCLEFIGIFRLLGPHGRSPAFPEKMLAEPGRKKTISSGSKKPLPITPRNAGSVSDFQNAHASSTAAKFPGKRYKGRMVFKKVSSPEKNGFSISLQYVKGLYRHLAKTVAESLVSCRGTEISHRGGISSQGGMNRGKKVFRKVERPRTLVEGVSQGADPVKSLFQCMGPYVPGSSPGNGMKTLFSSKKRCGNTPRVVSPAKPAVALGTKPT
jgi:hypothetical protein